MVSNKQKTFSIEELEKEVEKLFLNAKVKLIYHNFEHTKDFVNSMKTLIEAAGITGEDKENLIIAGYLHDIGCINGLNDHEERGAELAEKILSKYGFNKERIEKIKDLILATRVETEPKNELHKLMRDADIANFGKDSFFEKTHIVYQELKDMKVYDGDLKAWYEVALKLLEKPFFSEVAERLWGKKRRENAKKLRRKIEKMK